MRSTSGYAFDLMHIITPVTADIRHTSSNGSHHIPFGTPRVMGRYGIGRVVTSASYPSAVKVE